MTTDFKPKQIISINDETLKEFLGSATEAVAYDFLRPLIPFPSGCHVHDNGCGTGVVTEAIIALQLGETTSQLSPPRISASDKNAALLTRLQSRAQSERWPVEVTEMDCTALAFPDDTFTHSFTNFVILQVLHDDVKCASEIYRTLQPGGLAIVTTWEHLATMTVFREAHHRVYGEARELPKMLQPHWYGGKHVIKAMSTAGFDEDKLSKAQYTTRVKIEDIERWCGIGWSICGKPEGGWTQEDEQRWEEAIGYTREVLTTNPCFQADESLPRGGWLKLTASAAVARK